MMCSSEFVRLKRAGKEHWLIFRIRLNQLLFIFCRIQQICSNICRALLVSLQLVSMLVQLFMLCVVL
jgi:hypothetical protein